MKQPATTSYQPEFFPRRSPTTPDWEHIQIEEFQHPAGEGTCHFADRHTISMSLAPSPVRLLHKQDGKTYSGFYGKGDMAITPANTPLFARWDSDDRFMQIRLTDRFVKNVAMETMEKDPARLELIPQFRSRNPQIEAIAMMLLTEFARGQASSNRLYIDSLTNALTVNFLRHHATIKPQVAVYEGGLPPYQLKQILDYIDAHLDREIKLADLAQLLNLSQFHFSRLFKQSLGISPHQYVIQQRLERAKQLLKKTDRLITDIAIECGFNSHSHLTNKFRQVIGMTPKAYRVS